MADYRVPTLENYQFQPSVKSRVASLPGSPAKGDRYLLTATGDVNKIATYNGSTWDLTIPIIGMETYVEDEKLYYTYDGSNWRLLLELFVNVKNYASINAAVTAIGASQVTLVVPNAQTLTASLTIPSTLSLKILNGGSIVKASTYTLTINGPFEAGLYQVFSGFSAEDVTFSLVKEVFPEWWGTTDFGLALQSAINSSSKVVISPGTHTFTVAHYAPGDASNPIGVYLKDNLHIVIEKGATVTQANNLNLMVFFAGNMWGTGQATVLTNVTIEVHGMIDGNYANQSYAADAAYQACPIALFATKSNFPIVRAKNFGRYGALVLYYGPHLNVGYVYAENGYDNTYNQAQALDLEAVNHANIGSVIGTALQGAIVNLPDGGSFINIDSINGKNSFSTLQMVPHSGSPGYGLHDINIGNVVGEGNLGALGGHGILIDAYDGRLNPQDIAFGNVNISNCFRDGVKIVQIATTTARVRNIQFGNVRLKNNGQGLVSGFRNGFSLGYCDNVKVVSLIAYDDQTPKTQYYGIEIYPNTTHFNVENGDISGNVVAENGYDPTYHLFGNVIGAATNMVYNTGNQSISGIKTFSDTTEASNATTGGTVISGGLAVAKRVYATDMTVTNKITGSISGTADGNALLASSISDADTTHAPDGNSVFDALALKAPIASPTFTTTINTPTIGLTGGQIAFPAAQAASADVNTLDDYEEGTWVPDLQFGGAKVGITYNASYHLGTYTKIGNKVFFSAYIVLSSKGSSTGDARLYGLPFSSNGTDGFSSLFTINPSNALTFTAGNMLGGRAVGAYLEMHQYNPVTGSGTYLTDANFANGTTFMVSGHYTI